MLPVLGRRAVIGFRAHRGSFLQALDEALEKRAPAPDGLVAFQQPLPGRMRERNPCFVRIRQLIADTVQRKSKQRPALPGIKPVGHILPAGQSGAVQIQLRGAEIELDIHRRAGDLLIQAIRGLRCAPLPVHQILLLPPLIRSRHGNGALPVRQRAPDLHPGIGARQGGERYGHPGGLRRFAAAEMIAVFVCCHLTACGIQLGQQLRLRIYMQGLPALHGTQLVAQPLLRFLLRIHGIRELCFLIGPAE